MRAPTAFLLHPSASLHDTGWGHPEHQGRLRFLSSTVGKDMLALFGRAEQAQPGEASEEDLLAVHTPEHIARVREAVALAEREARVVELDADTRVSSASWEAAMGSLGAALTAAGGVADGRFRNAFVATRPPGHHATPDRAMGFCLFNTVAATARWLQSRGHAERVLIVDWDVHHGNGTQDVFWEDPSVYFLSLHQYPWWPGSGAASERGGGAGQGTTLNVPLAAGTTADVYGAAFHQALDRVFDEFRPDFILVSSGFDALAEDPLGGLLLEPGDFHGLTRSLMARADAACGGRMVALLEGGYDPRRTGLAAVAVIRALADILEADPTVPVAPV
ncbi:MAG TPA: histone deacetylase [Longimicrobiales bacterium]|nr:histone deacetylase [Longimicrobiales bacterium]